MHHSSQWEAESGGVGGKEREQRDMVREKSDIVQKSL